MAPKQTVINKTPRFFITIEYAGFASFVGADKTLFRRAFGGGRDEAGEEEGDHPLKGAGALAAGHCDADAVGSAPSESEESEDN